MKLRGYIREADDGKHPYAVRWWFVDKVAGGVFARGGWVRDSRAARRAIDDAIHELDIERKRIAAHRQPSAVLTAKGIRDISRHGADAHRERIAG